MSSWCTAAPLRRATPSYQELLVITWPISAAAALGMAARPAGPRNAHLLRPIAGRRVYKGRNAMLWLHLRTIPQACGGTLMITYLPVAVWCVRPASYGHRLAVIGLFC